MGTGVKFLRTDMLVSAPHSSCSPPSPPVVSSRGMTPKAILRVSRAAICVSRSTIKSGKGSSGCSLASERTAWSTIQNVTSPERGFPVSSVKRMPTSTSCPGRALLGASILTVMLFFTGVTSIHFVAAMVTGLP